MRTIQLDPIAGKPKEKVLEGMVVTHTHNSRGSASMYFTVRFGEHKMVVRVSDHFSAKTSHMHTLHSNNPQRVTDEEVKEHAYNHLKEKYFNEELKEYAKKWKK